ncbi:MAG: hypothetical protein ACR2RL_26425 [Gammaproteobacteria bacterium]
MNEQPAGESQRPMPSGSRSFGSELVIPGLALLFTVYYFVSIHEAPWTAKASTYFIGGILLALIVVFVALALKTLASGAASLSFAPLFAPPELALKRLGLLGLVGAYIYVLEFGGFTLSTFLFLYLAMLTLGGLRVARIGALVAGACALGGYVLFIAVFETRFPQGPFETLMNAVLP